MEGGEERKERRVGEEREGRREGKRERETVPIVGDFPFMLMQPTVIARLLPLPIPSGRALPDTSKPPVNLVVHQR